VQILLSIGGVLVAIVAFLLIPRASSVHRLKDKPQGAPTLSMTGGGIWMHTYWPVSATWPLVRLELFSWGVRVGPNVEKLDWLLPTTELTWAEIRSATHTTFGVRFRGVDAPGWIIFNRLSGLDPELWRQLNNHGVSPSE
jgi:hypothetical protein